MARFVEGMDRGQATLLPVCLEDWVDENNPVRAVDVFVGALDLVELGFDGAQPMRRAPRLQALGSAQALHLRLSQRVQSSRRLEREAGRNLEVMWLTGRLAPDHKTIADFRKDNVRQSRRCCTIRRAMPQDGTAGESQRAIDGSKFKAVNSRDNNFTKGSWSGG